MTESKWNWKTAVCVSGLQFGRVRTGVIGAMACNMLHGRPCDSYSGLIKLSCTLYLLKEGGECVYVFGGLSPADGERVLY